MEIDFSQYLPNDKKTIIAAIEKSNPEVISSQIVAQTKLPVHTVEILLSQIASETHGHILVTSDGNLIYKFKPDLKKEYILNASQNFLQFWIIKICELIYYCLRLSTGLAIFIFRISFAIILLSSIILITILVIWIILVILFGGNNSNSGGDSGAGLSDLGSNSSSNNSIDWGDLFSGFNSNFIGIGSTNYNQNYSLWDSIFPQEYWLWNPTKYDYKAYKKNNANEYLLDPSSRNRSQGNFLFNCFTFLFGEGNPNLNLEDRRLSLITDTIKANQGSIIFEQIAPYLDLKPSDINNEDKILPILARFNGYPKVTQNGNLIYIFENFQISRNPQKQDLLSTEFIKLKEQASTNEALHNLVQNHLAKIESQPNIPKNEVRSSVAKIDNYLHAFPWEFCNLTKYEVMPIFIFGFINLFGSIGLLSFFNYLSKPNNLSLAKHFTAPDHLKFLNQFIQANHSNLIHVLTIITTAMLVYAVIFWLIPIIRWLVLAVFNEIINQKNENRKDLAFKLINPDKKLQQKLNEAKNYQTSKQISPEIIYTTQEDILNQEFKEL